MAYVKDKGTLIVGITEFEPMDSKKDGLSYFCPFGHRVNHEYGAEKGRDAMNTTIYQNIATRTAGDIYIGNLA